jgi:nucleotide-binding universal stress UspA family protein
VVYIPFLQPFFDAVPPTLDDWLLMLPFFFVSPIAMELLKGFFRARAAAREAEQLVSNSGPVGGFAPQGAFLAPAGQSPEGGNAMLKILVPVDGSKNCEAAVRHVIKQFMNNTAMEVHLLNLQAPFSRDISHFVGSKTRHEYHHEQSEKALAPVRSMLDSFSIPYAVHEGLGADRAKVITDNARRLRCDQIVMATSRKNSLTRWVESSVTDRVLELTPVPVEVIAGSSMSPWERWGIPAGLAAIAALVLAIED